LVKAYGKEDKELCDGDHGKVIFIADKEVLRKKKN